jgi:hypothetical protein
MHSLTMKFNKKSIFFEVLVTLILCTFLTTCKNSAKTSFLLTPEQKKVLDQSGIKTTGSVFILKNEKPQKAFYTFQTAEGKHISQKLEISFDSTVLLSNGFPLLDRDEFEVIYLAEDPKVNQINYNQPTPLQIQNYLRLAAAVEVAKHPEKKPAECMCKVFNTEQKNGWQSIAHIYNQGEKSTKNVVFNEDSYKKLYEDTKLVDFIAKRCKSQ